MRSSKVFVLKTCICVQPTVHTVSVSLLMLLAGWFLNGNDVNFEFLAMVLETLQNFENLGMKRMPDQALNPLYRCFNRTVLLRFSELEQFQSTNEGEDPRVLSANKYLLQPS